MTKKIKIKNRNGILLVSFHVVVVIFFSVDSALDISDDFIKDNTVYTVPLHIILGSEDYLDGFNITPDFIYKTYKKNKVLPKTAAVSEIEYEEHFKKLLNSGADEIVHISLSSAISSTYNNAKNAAKKLQNVYVVDSKNLSLGGGILVFEGLKMAKLNEKADKIANELKIIRQRVDASFVLTNLDFISAGGRCSNVMALGANLFNIKPLIKVDNKQGKISVSKIYRGKLETVLPKYISEKLKSKKISGSNFFVTYSEINEKNVETVCKTVRSFLTKKQNLIVCKTGCTISSHCGPGTLGMGFITE